MNKGIVLKVKKQYAIVLRDDHLYCKIKIKGRMTVGQKIWFLEEDVLQTKTQNRDFRRSIAAIATVAALFAVMMITPLMQSETSYSIVSVDINPSLEMQVDEDGQVIGIEPLNSEAEEVIQGIELERPVTQVLNDILEAAEALNYLNGTNNYVLISTADAEEDGSLADDLESFIANHVQLTSNVKIFLIESNQETAEEAHEKGISLGRMELSKITNKDAEDIGSVKDAIEADEEDFVENLLTASETEDDQALESEDEDLLESEDEDLLESEDEDLLDSVNRILAYLLEIAVDDANVDTFLDNHNIVGPITEGQMNQAQLVDLHKILVQYWNDIKQDYRSVWTEDSDDEEKAELIESLAAFVANLNLIYNDDTYNPVLNEENIDPIEAFLEKIDGVVFEDIHKDILIAWKKEAQNLWQDVRMDYKNLWQVVDDEDDDSDEDYADLYNRVVELNEILRPLNNNSALDTVTQSTLATFIASYDEVVTSTNWMDLDHDRLKEVRSSGQAILNNIRKNYKDLLEPASDDPDEEDDGSGKPADKPKGKPDKESE